MKQKGWVMTGQNERFQAKEHELYGQDTWPQVMFLTETEKEAFELLRIHTDKNGEINPPKELREWVNQDLLSLAEMETLIQVFLASALVQRDGASYTWVDEIDRIEIIDIDKRTTIELPPDTITIINKVVSDLPVALMFEERIFRRVRQWMKEQFPEEHARDWEMKLFWDGGEHRSHDSWQVFRQDSGGLWRKVVQGLGLYELKPNKLPEAPPLPAPIAQEEVSDETAGFLKLVKGLDKTDPAYIAKLKSAGRELVDLMEIQRKFLIAELTTLNNSTAAVKAAIKKLG